MRSRSQTVLVTLVVIHVLFCAQRIPKKGFERRAEQLEHIATKGRADFFLYRLDPGAAPLVEWLLANTPPDAAVLYDAPWQGTMEVVAALLHPRLLYSAAAVPPDRTDVAGRPIARGTHPTLGAGTFVLSAEGAHLTLRTR